MLSPGLKFLRVESLPLLLLESFRNVVTDWSPDNLMPLNKAPDISKDDKCPFLRPSNANISDMY